MRFGRCVELKDTQQKKRKNKNICSYVFKTFDALVEFTNIFVLNFLVKLRY